MAVRNSAGGKAVDNINCFISSVRMGFFPPSGLNQVTEKPILCPMFILFLAHKPDILQTGINQIFYRQGWVFHRQGWVFYRQGWVTKGEYSLKSHV